MNLTFDCYECVIKQALLLARDISADDAKQRKIAREMLNYFLDNAEKIVPPEMALYLFSVFERETKNADPLREIKIKSTRLGIELLEEFRELVNSSEDPLKTVIRLSIGGNIIDYGVNPDFQLADAAGEIRKVLDMPYDHAAIDDLADRIRSAKQVFYILDNCGEAVLDRLVLENIPCKTVVGVRGKPIINDVTRTEAEESGITDWEIVDTGVGAPGVLLDKAPAEFLDAIEKSSLVIAKGQGNFESLESTLTGKPLYFLLRVKCKVIAKFLGVEMGSIQIIGRNL
jgi:uncharacterized protein with ATP-grasp and redox domains